MLKRSLIALLLLSASVSPAFAERTLTLIDALELGLKGNPELRAMTSSVEAGKDDIGIARSNLLPKIVFEERFMRTTNPTFAFSSKLNQERFSSSDFAIESLNHPQAINDFQTSVTIEQPLYVRKANIGLEMARKEYSAKREDLSRKKEEVALNIFKTFIMVNTSAGFVTVAEKGIEDAKEHLRLANARYDTGLGLYSDVLRASTALTEAEQRLISARKNNSVSKRALGLLLGLSEDVNISGMLPELPYNTINYYNDASSERRDVKSLSTRYENARNNIELARSDYFPMLGLGGSYQLNDHNHPLGAEGDSWQVSAFLRWNIFDGTQRKYESSKARHKANEAFEYLNGLKKAVSYKVYEAYLGVEEAKKNSELSSSAVKTAEEGERLIRVRYENSLSPIIDLIDASLSLDNARANLVSKTNEYLLSLANLSYESGLILKDLDVEGE